MTSLSNVWQTGKRSGTAPVLEVEQPDVWLPTEDGDVHAVRGTSFELRRGEVLGIVGESGSGKSATSLAVLGLLPRIASVTGSVRLNGRELLGLPDAELSGIRGRSIAMIFQDPMTSLNPVYTVGSSIRVFQDLRLSGSTCRRPQNDSMKASEGRCGDTERTVDAGRGSMDIDDLAGKDVNC